MTETTGIQPVPLDPSSAGLEHMTASLAFELARRLVPWQTTIAAFGVTEDQFRVLLGNPAFQKLVKEAKATWESTSSVAERTRLKAQFALETCLLPIHSIVHNPQSGTQSRIDAAKLIASIAGMSKGDSAAGEAGKGFQLNIHLGEKTVSVVPTGPLIDQSN